MTIRDRNAEKFEQWVRQEVLKRDLSEASENGKCTFEITCPCCKIGKVRMQVNLKQLTVIAACAEFGLEGQCETHQVSMPLNVFQKRRRFDSE